MAFSWGPAPPDPPQDYPCSAKYYVGPPDDPPWCKDLEWKRRTWLEKSHRQTKGGGTFNTQNTDYSKSVTQQWMRMKYPRFVPRDADGQPDANPFDELFPPVSASSFGSAATGLTGTSPAPSARSSSSRRSSSRRSSSSSRRSSSRQSSGAGLPVTPVRVPGFSKRQQVRLRALVQRHMESVEETCWSQLDGLRDDLVREKRSRLDALRTVEELAAEVERLRKLQGGR